MVSGATSPSGDLKQLRQQYDRLCDLMTRAAETDPVTAERVLGELQALSERILALEAAQARSEPAEIASMPQMPAFRSEGSGPTFEVPPPGRAEGGRDPRILSFRVTSAAHAGPSPTPSSWRIDPPPDQAADRMPAAEAEPTGAPAPAEPTRPPSAPGAPGNATVFSTAIRQWLERHRQKEHSAARPWTAIPPADAAPPTGPASEQGQPQATIDFARMAAALEQQAAQIDRIIRLCEAHQSALEQLQGRIIGWLEALQPPSKPQPDIEQSLRELREAVGQQRSRITALAKTIHNLAQWLAAQQAASDR